MSNRAGLSALGAFKEKKEDCRLRLAKNFICFTRSNGFDYLIIAGDEPETFISVSNFSVAIVGGSSGDLVAGESLVREVISVFGSTFSPRDVHAILLRDYLSETMRSSLEDRNVVRGLAVEFVVLDFLGNLILVYFTGDYHVILNSEINDERKRSMFFAGCYDEKYRKNAASVISSIFSDLKDPDEKKIRVVISQLKKDLNLDHCGVVIFERIGADK